MKKMSHNLAQRHEGAEILNASFSLKAYRLNTFFKIKKVFDGDIEGLGDPLAAGDGRGIDPAFDKTDELNGVARLFGELLLRKALGFPQLRNSSP